MLLLAVWILFALVWIASCTPSTSASKSSTLLEIEETLLSNDETFVSIPFTRSFRLVVSVFNFSESSDVDFSSASVFCSRFPILIACCWILSSSSVKRVVSASIKLELLLICISVILTLFSRFSIFSGCKTLTLSSRPPILLPYTLRISVCSLTVSANDSALLTTSDNLFNSLSIISLLSVISVVICLLTSSMFSWT